MNNISLYHEDVKFIFSTLWSKISPVNEWLVLKSVSDFEQIKYGGHRFNVSDFNNLHVDCLAFIVKELNLSHDEETVVVSHHVPTFLNYPIVYKGSLLNEAFAVELFPFIESSNVDYWIYGHHHRNTPNFNIGKTQLLTNQLGYVKYGEHKMFRPDRVIIL